MRNQGTPTRDLAGFCAALTLDHTPEQARNIGKQLLLDWIASAAAGAGQPPSRMVVETVDLLGGKPQATLIGYCAEQSATHAALVNGVSSHILEMDDVHKPTISHPGSALLPAAVSIAELTQATGKTLLEAILAGYEVALRVGEAIHPSSYHFWHTTPVAGVFGAAVASGKLLGFEAEKMTHVLGTAGSMAAGLCEHFREKVMTGHLHTGLSSMNGALAALVTDRGMTAATTILEGPRGFLKAVAPLEDKAHVLTVGLGERYKVEEVTLKHFPACSHTHAAIEAAIQITRSPGWDPTAIARVEVRSNDLGMRLVDVPDPWTPWEAKLSLQYTVAAALLRRRCVLEDFDPAAIADEDVRKLLPKIGVLEDEALSARRDAWPNVVTVTLVNGTAIERRVDHPYGDPHSRMSDADLTAKATRLLGRILSTRSIERLIEQVLTLEEMKNIRELTAPFREA